jgi:hypothetical protein
MNSYGSGQKPVIVRVKIVVKAVYEVLVATSVTISVLCDVTPCSPVGIMWHDEFE